MQGYGSESRLKNTQKDNMADSPNFYATQAKRAEEEILGTKFCFACQKHRPLATGRRVGPNRKWRCADCAAKVTPCGFKKKKQ